MSTETATPATETTSAPAKPAKKAKKATKPAKVVKSSNELTKTQIVLLRALSKSRVPLTGSQVAKAAKVDSSVIGLACGYVKAEINRRPVHKNNLVSRGLVSFAPVSTENGSDAKGFMINAKGRAALAKAQ